MATGFGCMVVGPAGSGKVSAQIKWLSRFLTRMFHFLVDNVPHLAASGGVDRTNNQSLQFRPGCRSVQVPLRHRHSWFDLAWGRARVRKLWSKWRSSILHGASSWEHWLAGGRAGRVRGRLIYPFRLSWSDRAIFALRCDVKTQLCDNKEWFLSLRSVLRRWHLPKRADQIYCNQSYVSISSTLFACEYSS